MDEAFNESYERCWRRQGFIERFYDNFIAGNEAVAERFAGTDMPRQRRMLEASLHMLMALHGTDPSEAVAHFRRIGKIHGRRDKDIPPELYEHWLDSLVATVREFDERFDKRVETAWRAVLADGIRIMKSMY